MVTDYKVLTPYAVGLHCRLRPGLLPVSGVLVDTTDAAATPINSELTITAPRISHDWLIVSWTSGAASDLKPKRSYSLRLEYTAAGPSPGPAPLVVALDTSETVTLSAAAASRPLDFRVLSHIAFAADGDALSILKLNLRRPGDLSHTFRTCQLPIRNLLGKPYAVDAQCSQLTAPLGATPTAGELAQLDLGLVGILNLRLRTLPGTPLTPASIPIHDVLGGEPAFDPSSRFARQEAPASRDAARLYLNGNYSGGVGSAPAWTLNSKYSPVLLLYHRFSVGPFLSTDIGNNAVPGQASYANTIDAGATAQTVFRPGRTLQLLVMTPGVVYETDQQFDRDNLLFTLDTQEFFAGLYDTQQTQAFRQFGRLLGLSSAAKLTDVKTPAFGYALDTHVGIETGSAVGSHVIHASTGPAEALLPQFGIVRVAPHVHGLLQLSRLSLDESMVGRYLVETEDTVFQTPEFALGLQKIHGWKALSTFTGNYVLDTQGNFNLSVIYQSGFAPPDYQRVNAVEAGLTVKF
jgi:hypothetical protein